MGRWSRVYGVHYARAWTLGASPQGVGTSGTVLAVLAEIDGCDGFKCPTSRAVRRWECVSAKEFYMFYEKVEISLDLCAFVCLRGRNKIARLTIKSE